MKKHIVPALVIVAVIACGVLSAIRPARAQTADTADSLTLRIAKAISSARDTKRFFTTTSLASTGWTEAPKTDIAASLRNASVVQQMVVKNRDSSIPVCYTQKARILKLVDGGPTPDCAKLLDAGLTFPTCVTDAPDGGEADLVDPGKAQEVPVAGDDCFFVRASSSGADVQVTEVAR